MDTTHPGAAWAIATRASAGAALGPSFLGAAPATSPVVFTVVYLS